MARLRLKTLGQRGHVSSWQVKFNALNAVHREEDHRRGKRLAAFYDDGEIIERCKFDSADAQALRRKRKNHSPEFVSRVA
jgi:hypothetical protein